jgi:hypothetical protein
MAEFKYENRMDPTLFLKAAFYVFSMRFALGALLLIALSLVLISIDCVRS